MSEAVLGADPARAFSSRPIAATPRWPAASLALAAAPAFAAMALATAAHGDGTLAVWSAAPAFPLGGMAAMYAMMAIAHLPPWLRLTGRGA